MDDCVKALLWDIMASQERRNSQVVTVSSFTKKITCIVLPPVLLNKNTFFKASEMVKPGDEEVIRLQKQTLTNTAGKNKPGCCV